MNCMICERPLPPANLEFEQCLIARILKGEPCLDFLGAQHFADPIHGLIYATMESIQRRRALTLPVLQEHFELFGGLEEVGGPLYLSQIVTGSRLTLTAKEYARAIHDLWVERTHLDQLLALMGPPPTASVQEAIQ